MGNEYSYSEEMLRIKGKIEGIIKDAVSRKSNEVLDFGGMDNQVQADGSNGTYIYIRIEPKRINLSNVTIAEQRKGILSKIVNKLKADKDINKQIVISSVITDEMRNFCKKMGATLDTHYGVEDYIM